MTALDDAVAVFRDLGWAEAGPAQALDLPLGTPEQRRTAKAGVATGPWGGFGQLGPRSYGWISMIDVDRTMFTLFALRQGVPARRAAELLRHAHGVEERLLAAAAAEGGDPGAVARALYPGDGGRHWTIGVAVRLLVGADAEPPSGRGYLRAWTDLVAGAFDHGGPALDLTGWRLADHVRAAVAAGIPGAGSPEAGPIAPVLVNAVTAGALDRAEGVELAYGGLDSAQRPSDRLAWVDALRALDVTDDDLRERADALVPLLGFGDAPLIEALAPLLLEADDATALDVVTVALAARTKKTRKDVLTRAAARRRPEGAEAIADLIAAQAGDKDKGIARAAAALAAAWGLDAEPEADGPAVAVGMWRPTPPVWTVPPFELPEPTPGALTDAAAVLTSRPEGSVRDVEQETFAALAVAVAHADPTAARAALRGAKTGWRIGLGPAAAWVRGEPNRFRDLLVADDEGHRSDRWLTPAQARDAQVYPRLGELPALLSTPSRVDLSVLPTDLIARLTAYATAGVAVSEGDLMLAATRLDLDAVTAADRAALAALPVPVLGSRGPLDVLAGPFLAAYSLDPYREPPLDRQVGFWLPGAPATPASMAGLPPRIRGGWGEIEQDTFPHWRESFTARDGGETSGAALLQLARRAAPLAPVHAIDMLEAQLALLERDPATAADAAVAAFERGLLRPGAAEAEIDERNLAAFAAALVDTARLGLASVVWGVLDALLVRSVAAPRMLSGTAEVAEALGTLLPEARAAVEAGIAEPAVLDLPGLRALAARSGSSRAVTTAKALVADLPAPTAAPAPTEPPEVPFEEAWPAGVGTAPTVADGARLRARWATPDAPSRFLGVEIELDGARYWAHKTWFYDLTQESQCQVTDESTGHDAWLWWDGTRLAAAPTRNRTDGNHSPLRLDGPKPPLTTAMTAVVLAGLCHDRETYGARGAAKLLGTGAVRAVMPELLASPDLSAARIVGALDDNPALLPTLWPVLTESVRYAAAQDKPPHWLNRVLDAALRHAPTLAEAARRGLIPAPDAAWPGLREIAARPGSAVALRKARDLVGALGL